jgi:hypothetical protein
MRRFATRAWAAAMKRRSPATMLVAVGTALVIVSAFDLLWSSWGGHGDRVALALGSLTGALGVVGVGAILGWRRAGNHDRSGPSNPGGGSPL